jgi:rhamnogalacturonyl hydrolase YesR
MENISPSKTAPTPDNDLFAQRIVELCQTKYVGTDGVLITSLGASGDVEDDTPLVADFGDVLPFLYLYDAEEFATGQVELGKKHLTDGLFAEKGIIKAFSNHDFLLGLIDMYELTDDSQYLDMASRGVTSLRQKLGYKGFLLNQASAHDGNKGAIIHRANPFNGGYIELYCDMFRVTGEQGYLNFAEEEAEAWLRSSFFRRHGLFQRIELADNRWLYPVIKLRMIPPLVRLFKDNTNLLYSLVELYAQTEDDLLSQAIFQWVEGFEKHFWNAGNVYLHLDKRLQGYEVSLKAAFSALDLLCDIHWRMGKDSHVLDIARSIADKWLDTAWPNGLFPLDYGGSIDHLDANADMSVALAKLHQITGDDRYRQAYELCVKSLCQTHSTDHGYVLSIDRSGTVADPTIVVKYQGLMLKLALLSQSGSTIYGDDRLFNLMRDR